MNSGRKALKNNSPLGFVAAERAPCRKSAQPLTWDVPRLACTTIGAERHT